MKKFLFTLCVMALSFLSVHAQVVFSADFESGMPAGWTQTTNATDGGWNAGDAASLASANFPISDHTNFIGTNDDACNCLKNADILMTSTFSLVGVSSPFLKFDNYYYDLTYNGITESANVLYSIDGGSNWILLNDVAANTGDWETRFVDLSPIGSQASVMLAFEYNDGGDWLYGWMLDNVSVFGLPSTSATLSSVAPVAGTPSAYGGVGTSVDISGTIMNSGASTINAITVEYSDGTNTYTDNLTGLNLASFGSYNFTHNSGFIVPSTGNHNIDVWITLVGDADNSDDMISTTIVGVAFVPVHNVVFEEATGTWCGWCPRGSVNMDLMATSHPDACLIAVHNGDPMTDATYDGGVGSFPGFSGYPSVLSDRKMIVDPSAMETYYAAHKDDFGFAEISGSSTFNSGTREAVVSASAELAVDLNGDYRFACVFTENGVTGTDAGYNQTNYYAGGGNGPMGGYESLPSSVPAAQMVYEFVARTILGGFSGQSGSLPGSMTAGQTYNYSFNYTIPAGFDENEMKAIILLIDNGSDQILNAAQMTVGGNTGIVFPVKSIGTMNVYPNPATNNVSISLNLDKSSDVTVMVTDILGKVIAVYNEGQLSEGSSTIAVDVANLPAGTYNINVVAEDGMMAKTIVKN